MAYMARLSDPVINHFIKKYGGNFTAEEFMPDREHLQREIITEVVRFRNWIEVFIEITSAYRESGSHETGLALDFIPWSDWQKEQPDPMWFWRKMTMWPFMGVGIYFDWERGIGFHADVIREARERPLRWLRVDGTYFYQMAWDGAFYAENQSKTTLEFEIKTYHEQHS